jgi:hypothetical protein
MEHDGDIDGDIDGEIDGDIDGDIADAGQHEPLFSFFHIQTTQHRI